MKERFEARAESELPIIGFWGDTYELLLLWYALVNFAVLGDGETVI